MEPLAVAVDNCIFVAGKEHIAIIAHSLYDVFSVCLFQARVINLARMSSF
jgi:hypothetical protein